MYFDASPVLDMDAVIANSYKNFHTRGADYICLERTPTLTTKLYFFDGDVSTLPEVVSPHDHRYDFNTFCLSGEVENVWYAYSDAGATFQRFDYRTPLNGGNGFTWAEEVRLSEVDQVACRSGQMYFMSAEELHTIRIRRSETVIMISQFHDTVDIDVPTSTFTQDVEPPSLEGLYDQFTPDEILAKMRLLKRLDPNFLQPTFE